MIFKKSNLFALSCSLCVLSSNVLMCEEIAKPTELATVPIAIDLETAIERTLQNSPHLMIGDSEVGVAASERWQSGLWPNPIFSFEINRDFDDDMPTQGQLNSCTEYTYALTQLIELGGKRAARLRLGAQKVELFRWESEILRLDITRNIIKAFVNVVAAQETVRIAEEQHGLTKKMLETVNAKVQAGKVASLQSGKAQVANVNTALILEKAQRNFLIAKKKLAVIWGSNDPDFETVTFPFFDVKQLPKLQNLHGQIENSPDNAKWQAALCLAWEVVQLEKTQRIPDITITAGYAHCSDEGAGVFGASIPLPIINRNQGNISKAQFLYYQIQEKEREDILRREIELADAYQEWEGAYNTVTAYQEKVIPAATSAFNGSREGYEQGKYEYLDMLDAQRTLFETQKQYIDALVDYHSKKTDVLRLIGTCNYP